MKKKPLLESITGEFIRTVTERLVDGERVRRTLPPWGRLHIDRQLPFLCVYRRPSGGGDRGTDSLVMSEASYLTASGDRAIVRDLKALVRSVVDTLSNEFGAFLLVELWSSAEQEEGSRKDAETLRPGFTIITSFETDLSSTVDAMAKELRKIRVQGHRGEIEIEQRARVSPPGMSPLLGAAEARRAGCYLLGLEVDPIYRDMERKEIFPVLHQSLRRSISHALKHAFYAFTWGKTTHTPPHFHSLGQRAVTRVVWEVDTRLAEVSESFDLLMQVTPINSSQAFSEFRRRKFARDPAFYYRPLSFDPELIKRTLFNIPVERIEDVTLGNLFREKQEELDRQITMLRDRGTPRFLYESMQLYGDLKGGLVELAKDLLRILPPRSRDDAGEQIDADGFARCAREEFKYYRSIYPDFSSAAQVRPDLTPGLLVSHGYLLIGKETQIPASRADALLQHEVGTHIITYINGRAQPLKQLYCGLAGYDELQEGLAVLAEYLVGGLSSSRLRVLAARVIAAQSMIDGASFIETFNLLNHTHGFTQRTAFTITMRIYRGGGLTKDAIYLRGLDDILSYLGDGGTLEPLFVGKIASHHIPIIQELQFRNVLAPAPLRPRYMERPDAQDRLAQLRKGMTVLDLVPGRKKAPARSRRFQNLENRDE